MSAQGEEHSEHPVEDGKGLEEEEEEIEGISGLRVDDNPGEGDEHESDADDEEEEEEEEAAEEEDQEEDDVKNQDSIKISQLGMSNEEDSEEEDELKVFEIMEKLVKEAYEDGKEDKSIVHSNGSTEIKYKNGTRKITSGNEDLTKWLYSNGDIKEVYSVTGITRYFYAESCTWQTTTLDEIDTFEFKNGQIEKRFPDGRVEIYYPNKAIKTLYPDGREKQVFPDKSVFYKETNGEKVIIFANGQKEVHRQDYKMRIYANGTSKIVYKNGNQETHYPNGHVRFKDKNGVITTFKDKPVKGSSSKTKKPNTTLLESPL